MGAGWSDCNGLKGEGSPSRPLRAFVCFELLGNEQGREMYCSWPFMAVQHLNEFIKESF